MRGAGHNAGALPVHKYKSSRPGAAEQMLVDLIMPSNWSPMIARGSAETLDGNGLDIAVPLKLSFTSWYCVLIRQKGVADGKAGW